MALRALNPNQFALPGTEHLSDNPFAGHLAQGYHVQFESDRNDHWLTAHHATGRAATLDWARRTHPGEINIVSTVDRPGQRHRGKGLATALYRLGTEVDMGQDTIPVHSAARSNDGKAWSRKVGGYGPNNMTGDNHLPLADAPHPYKERQAEQVPEPRKEIPGQGRLFRS